VPERRWPGTFDPGFLRPEAKLVETTGLGHERGLLGEVRKRRAAPQGQGVVEYADCDIGIHRQSLLCIPHERVESDRVELGGIEP
jgi:hypothetical protein